MSLSQRYAKAIFIRGKEKGRKESPVPHPHSNLHVSVSWQLGLVGSDVFVWVSTVSSTRPHDFRLSEHNATKKKGPLKQFSAQSSDALIENRDTELGFESFSSALLCSVSALTLQSTFGLKAPKLRTLHVMFCLWRVAGGRGERERGEREREDHLGISLWWKGRQERIFKKS